MSPCLRYHFTVLLALPGSQEVVIFVDGTRPPPAGSPLSISYGSHSVEQLLLCYGFTLPTCHDDVLMLPCPMPRDAPAARQKLLHAQDL